MFKIIEQESGVHRLYVPYDRGLAWEQWFLLSSDRHWDNPYSDWDLQERHLKQALQRNAIILDFGDLFCAMQGKRDKRGSKSSIRQEHNVSNYFDALVDTAADWFRPYKDNIALLCKGNHETAITTHNEIDLTRGLCSKLGVAMGRYGGYVQIMFKRDDHHNVSCSKVIRYFHGSGGGGKVTKGVIQAQRHAVDWCDGDIIVQGHVHERWDMTIPQERFDTHKGRMFRKYQRHIQLPTYKQEHFQDGWHDQRDGGPKPLGAAWLRFYNDGRDNLAFDVTWAE